VRAIYEGDNTVSSTDAEQQRVRDVYERRQDAQWFGFAGPAHARRLYSRYVSTLRLLDELSIGNLSNLNILDAGCGTGDLLLALLHWGADGARTTGIDIRSDAIDVAKARLPHVAIHCGDLREVPLGDSSADLIFLNTVLSSVSDKKIRAEIVNELRRVARPGAVIVVYDVIRKNPSNKNLIPISKAELIELAGHHRNLNSRLISLAPPIAGRLPRALARTHDILEAIPFLCTHRLTSFECIK
jgi:SAM-dependent methyltransferase